MGRLLGWSSDLARRSGAVAADDREERSVVADPDSVGVTIKRGGVEAAVVLFRGGWADVEAALVGGPEDPVLDAPELADVSAFGQLLDDVFEQLRRLAGLDGPKSGPTSSS
jgi:hypothetical protein